MYEENTRTLLWYDVSYVFFSVSSHLYANNCTPSPGPYPEIKQGSSIEKGCIPSTWTPREHEETDSFSAKWTPCQHGQFFCLHNCVCFEEIPKKVTRRSFWTSRRAMPLPHH
jgi:hypothetical protein